MCSTMEFYDFVSYCLCHMRMHMHPCTPLTHRDTQSWCHTNALILGWISNVPTCHVPYMTVNNSDFKILGTICFAKMQEVDRVEQREKTEWHQTSSNTADQILRARCVPRDMAFPQRNSPQLPTSLSIKQTCCLILSLMRGLWDAEQPSLSL